MRIYRQKGVFSIEMAFVLVAMSAFLYFLFDLGYQVIQRSQLHRTSYALVSVLKERKAFYSQGSVVTNWPISEKDAREMYVMAKRLLADDRAVIGVEIGYKSGRSAESSYSYSFDSIKCKGKPLTNAMTEGTKHDLNVYRVTLCRQVPAFFEAAVAGQEETRHRVLQSTSIFVGR